MTPVQPAFLLFLFPTYLSQCSPTSTNGHHISYHQTCSSKRPSHHKTPPDRALLDLQPTPRSAIEMPLISSIKRIFPTNGSHACICAQSVLYPPPYFKCLDRGASRDQHRIVMLHTSTGSISSPPAYPRYLANY